MSTETKLDVAALRSLLAKATPGKWEATGRAIDRADAPFTEIAVDRCDADWCGNSSGIERSDDAALIAAAVNALPALLDLAEGAGGLVTGRTFDPETLVLALDAATTRAEAAERENGRLRKALTALGIVPPDSFLDAVDDDELTGRRTLELDPLPDQRHRTRVTIALARQIRAALSAPRDDAESTTRSDHE